MTKKQMSLIAVALSAMIAEAGAVNRAPGVGKIQTGVVAGQGLGGALHQLTPLSLGGSLPSLPARVIPAGVAAGPQDKPGAPADKDIPKPIADRMKGLQKAVDGLEAPGADKSADGSSQSGRSLEDAMTGARSAEAGNVDLPEPSGPTVEQQVQSAKAVLDGVLAEVSKAIIGQDEMKKGILMAMIARGHVLLEGVPGGGKTRTARAFADAVQGSFQRVQGTPDKLPSDILGAEILQEEPETGRKSFQLLKGPVFTNILLADEVNRMTPKAQAALLEAMGEGRVTIGRETHELGHFTVLATQNPVEQKGVNPLPEAQLDRFMFKVVVPQPTKAELKQIRRINRLKEQSPKVLKVTNLEQLDEIRRLAESLPIADSVDDYIDDIAMAAATSKEFKQTVAYNVYTRSGIDLEMAARIHAVMMGRAYVSPADVRAVAPNVLRHRIAISFSAGEQTADSVIHAILDRTPLPSQSGLRKPAIPGFGQKGNK